MNRRYFYYIALAFILVVFAISVFWGGIFYLVDIPSFVIVFGLSVPLLGIAGLWVDFTRAIHLLFSSSHFYETYELKKSLHSVKALQWLILASGLYGTLLGSISLLQTSYSPHNFLPSISILLITLFYSVTAILLLMPIRFKLESLILDKEENNT